MYGKVLPFSIIETAFSVMQYSWIIPSDSVCCEYDMIFTPPAGVEGGVVAGVTVIVTLCVEVNEPLVAVRI